MREICNFQLQKKPNNQNIFQLKFLVYITTIQIVTSKRKLVSLAAGRRVLSISVSRFAVNRSVRLRAFRYCLQELQQVQGRSQAAGWKRGLAVMRNATGDVCAIRAKRDQQECY